MHGMCITAISVVPFMDTADIFVSEIDKVTDKELFDFFMNL